jgi:uncharacterized membrane protein YhfC
VFFEASVLLQRGRHILEEPKMNNSTYQVARAMGVLIGFPMALGYVWYLSHQSTTATIYFLSSIGALWGLAVVPRKLYQSSTVKMIVRILCLIAILSALPMIYGDIKLVDYAAIIIRFSVIVIDILLFIETYEY